MPSGIGTAGAGAELTSEQVARILVNPLQARSVVLAAGPRVFDSQGDPCPSPKLAPMSAVGMTAENVAVPESDPVFSEVTLLPSTLKSFKRGYRISNELVRHSVLAIASVMGQGHPSGPPWRPPPRTRTCSTGCARSGEGSGTGIHMLMKGDAGIAEAPPPGRGPPSGCWASRCALHPRCPGPRLAARSSWPT